MQTMDIEKKVEERANEIISLKSEGSVDNVIMEKVRKTDNVKEAIDLMTTTTALKQEGVVEKLVEEKEKELIKDAETKKLQAETDKLKQEKEKEIAEYDKVITAKKKEIEQLKVEADKAQEFFEHNKDILKHIGIREKKSLKTMYALMLPATIVFIIVQILLFPITLCGLVLEAIISILGSVCGEIKNQSLKIIIAVAILLLIVGVGFCVYYFGGQALNGININGGM